MSDAVFVSVRSLCDFTARRGDLDLALRPGASMAEGVAIHRRMATAGGPPGLRYEVAVAATLDGLRVRGRADAIDESDPEQITVEEFKAHRGSPEKFPAVRTYLHWAQVETYAALYALSGRQTGQPPRSLEAQRSIGSSDGTCRLRLRYVNVDTDAVSVETRRKTPTNLIESLRSRVAAFSAWSESEAGHRARRDASIRDLTFPLGEFRPGQRDLAGQIYRNCLRGRQLLAEAPTGLGKSVAAVFGALKAMPVAGLDKLFLLTCRTTGAESLLRAAQQCNPVRSLRVLELGSRQRACQRPGARCVAEECDLAVGFHDKLPAARAQAVESGTWTMVALASLAAAHRLCPYHLAHELVQWADLIVADVNHYFDRSAGLHALTVAEGWKTVVLVDEAHDLIDRARSMYSRAVSRRDVERLGRALPDLAELRALARSWQHLERQHPLSYQEVELPTRFSLRLAAASAAIAAALPELAEAAPEPIAQRAIESGFDLVALQSLAAGAGAGDTMELLRDEVEVGTRLRVRCIVPAEHLTGAWSAAAAVVLMSATLRPFEFHRDLLGLDADAPNFECPSPYRGQLQVVVRSDLSTRYRDRTRSAHRIAALVCEVFAGAPGNYMVFASSYQYLHSLREAIVGLERGIDTWVQVPRMSDADRNGFLARFATDGRGLGFAVLGGGFGEGIDLAGSRLCGAFIATLGLPQVNEPNEVTRRLIDKRFGDGWRLGYLVPGLTKVAQAGGRVVRTAADRGVLYLLDDRYARPEVRQALPRWWFE